MFPVMKSAHKVNGIIFIIMLVTMFIYSVPAVVGYASTQTDAVGLFMDGKLLRKFEKQYDKRFFAREPSVRFWADLKFRLFGEAANGAVIGKDGWLFTNQEYLVSSGFDSDLLEKIKEIDGINSLLSKNNKNLVLLPVPMKVDIYSEFASRLPDSRAFSLYDNFVAQLKRRSILVAPVREAFLEQRNKMNLFVKNDTHWSPDGARLAAQVFASENPQLLGSRDYSSHVVSEKKHRGDLLNFMQFDPVLSPNYFVPVKLPVYETLGTSNNFDESDLFGDTVVSTILVGTSYSKIDDWNFVGFLKEALHDDLISVAVEAKGPFQAMNDFIASKDFKDENIRTVIWEFPVRTLLVRNANVDAPDEQPHHF